jgi:hypothetical protein
VCLEAAYLALRRCAIVRRLAADDPAHRRIMAHAFGVVHVLVSGEATENGLTQQTDKRMAAVLARARIGERYAPAAGGKCLSSMYRLSSASRRGTATHARTDARNVSDGHGGALRRGFAGHACSFSGRRAGMRSFALTHAAKRRTARKLPNDGRHFRMAPGGQGQLGLKLAGEGLGAGKN